MFTEHFNDIFNDTFFVFWDVENSLQTINEQKVTVLTVLFSGYLNENGNLNLKNFEKYLEKLSEVRWHFQNIMDNIQISLSKICSLADSDILQRQ